MSITTTHPPLALDAVDLPNGVRIPYVESGDPSGVPLILLHGITDSWRSFEGVLPHLPSGLRAFSITQRGHGEAGRPDSYRVSDLAGDVVAFMDALGLLRAVVVGHSMGSIVAQRVAIDHPGRVAGLVLLGANAAFADAPGVDEMSAELQELGDPIDADYLRGFQESTLARPVAPGLVDVAVEESLKVSSDTLRALWEGVVLDDFSHELSRIAAPTLIGWGERDSFCVRAQQDALLAAIAGAELIVYEDAGHAMHWEDPERVADDIGRFALARR